MSGSNGGAWRRLFQVLAVVLALATLAAACGSSSDEDASGDDDGSTSDTAEEQVDTGDEDEVTATTEAPEVVPDTVATDLEPQYGGEITMAVEAETNTWDIGNSSCAVSCITIARQVAEPLLVMGNDGVPHANLVETFSFNDDFTELTLTMRAGITFHDGTPADGAALLRNIEGMKATALQGQVFFDVVEVEQIDDMSVVLRGDRPIRGVLPALTDRSGYMMSPAWWDDPEARAQTLVGTGPFVWDSWTPNEATVVTRNDSYWRTDHMGRELPYLDGITFVPINDAPARRDRMEAGTAQVTHDSEGSHEEFWKGEWVDDFGGGFLDLGADRETTYLMFNSGAPPFDDPRLREAVSLCSDTSVYMATRAPDSVQASGPFAAGAQGFLEDAGATQFDPEAGRALLDEIGFTGVITYGTTVDPRNTLTAQLFAQQWQENCGLTVEIDQFQQSELIGRALGGAFEVFLWRNHGQIDPAMEKVWWHTDHAQGGRIASSGLALNFGNIRDADVDAALDAMQATDDPAELTALAEQANQALNAGNYNIWLQVNEFQVVYADGVQGVGLFSLADGEVARPAYAGRTWLGEVWLEQ